MNLKCLAKFKLITLTLTNLIITLLVYREETKQTVKDQNQYSFWWFQLKWCRLNYLKIVEPDTVKYLLYPCHTHTHTHIQYTVDTIALDSWRCAWILFVIKHPLCSASCCTVGSSNSVFISNGWTVLCGGEIQLLRTPCDLTATLSK